MWFAMFRWSCAFVALGGLNFLGLSVARASSPFSLDLTVDVPAFGLALAGSSIAFVELPDPPCLPVCSPDSINDLDRSVIGNYSERIHTIADVAVLSIAVAPLVLDLADSRGDGWIEDAVVYAQTLLVAQAATQLTKVAVRRNAPFVYDPDVPEDIKRESADAPRSFFSGHTATAFAAATAYSTLFALRHEEGIWKWLVLGASLALASTVGILKVQAGYHFWTDIAAGALAGSSIGVLIPLLHVVPEE
jgi:membrane-associated phospholipid phosphatase